MFGIYQSWTKKVFFFFFCIRISNSIAKRHTKFQVYVRISSLKAWRVKGTHMSLKKLIFDWKKLLASKMFDFSPSSMELKAQASIITLTPVWVANYIGNKWLDTVKLLKQRQPLKCEVKWGENITLFKTLELACVRTRRALNTQYTTLLS